MRRQVFAILFLFLAMPSSSQDQELHEIKLGKGAKVETAMSPEDLAVNFFLLPLAFGYALPHYGFARYPYSASEGYGRGERSIALAAKTSRQLLKDGRQAQHAHLRVRGDNRLGWDFSMSSFDPGMFDPVRRGGCYTGHITANYLQSETALLEFGLGFASFQNPEPRGGASVELAVEAFPSKPWTFFLRGQGAVLHAKGFYDLSAGAGAAWRWFGVSLGYRALLNPLRNAYGPELSFHLWL